MQALQQVAEISVSYRPAIANKPVIISSLDPYTAHKAFYPAETNELQERFVVLYLNRRNSVIGAYQLSVGGITGIVADVRLIL